MRALQTSGEVDEVKEYVEGINTQLFRLFLNKFINRGAKGPG